MFLSVQPLAAADEADLLAFERENRAFFARIIGDRGDAFFAEFSQRHRALLAELRRGETRPYLVRDSAGKLVGRVNFTQIRDGRAALGYRFAEEVRGRGYATQAALQALALARAAGLREVEAVAALDNPASARVLAKVGFQAVPGGLEEVERGGQVVKVQRFHLPLT
ncbi:MAG: GNAT family N-acetyltransferase [Deinococcus sp.]|nr:GNAT family N-acetyltransferase [Deinococcus sp.]